MELKFTNSGADGFESGPETCETCGGKMTMHYRKVCFKCYKPEPETTVVYDFLDSVYHIQAQGNPGYKERMWAYAAHWDGIQNDSIQTFYLTPDWVKEEWREQFVKDIQLFRDTFDVPEGEEAIDVSFSW